MARLINRLNGEIDTAVRITTTATSTVAVAEGLATLAMQAKITVSTPAAVVVLEASVDPTANTLTKAAHGFLTGTKVQGTTVGTLPGGLSLLTDYFVIKVSADIFKLADSLVNALAGTAVDISDDGDGSSTWTPVALAGGVIKMQESVDDGTTWHDVAAGTNITVTADFLFKKATPESGKYRLHITLTAGELTYSVYNLGKAAA